VFIFRSVHQGVNQHGIRLEVTRAMAAKREARAAKSEKALCDPETRGERGWNGEPKLGSNRSHEVPIEMARERAVTTPSELK
jgi:hypothetical protein